MIFILHFLIHILHLNYIPISYNTSNFYTKIGNVRNKGFFVWKVKRECIKYISSKYVSVSQQLSSLSFFGQTNSFCDKVLVIILFGCSENLVK